LNFFSCEGVVKDFNLVNEAALLAARKNKEVVESADFDEAVDGWSGLQKKNRVMNPQEGCFCSKSCPAQPGHLEVPEV
jgi:hypothetical protein